MCRQMFVRLDTAMGKEGRSFIDWEAARSTIEL